MSPDNKKNTKSFLSGFLSGVFGAVLTQPLDVIKTTVVVNPLKTSQIDSLGHFRSLMLASKQVYYQDNRGIPNFFRGAISSAVK